MRVVKSTDDFKLRGVSIPDFPILMWTKNNKELGIKTGMLFEEGVDFLMYQLITRGRVDSKNSWATYGQWLCNFFSFCEDNNQNWREIADDGRNESLLAVYRDSCSEDFDLAASTVNSYLRIATSFYRYALGRGWVSKVPYSLESVKVNRPASFLAHVDNTSDKVLSPDVMLKTYKGAIKFLSSEEVATLLKSIKNETLKLMVRLCLQTGIRKKEVYLFPLDAIRKTRPDELKCTVYIRKTKGSKERSIDVPAVLMDDLWGYVNELRFQQQRDSGVETNCLFLTKEGKAFSHDSNAFNNALTALKLDFHVTPHMLRHTYATQMLRWLQQSKNLAFNAVMYIQARLGHARLSTTMIYLHLINDLIDDLSIEYQDAINSLGESEEQRPCQ